MKVYSQAALENKGKILFSFLDPKEGVGSRVAQVLDV